MNKRIISSIIGGVLVLLMLFLVSCGKTEPQLNNDLTITNLSLSEGSLSFSLNGCPDGTKTSDVAAEIFSVTNRNSFDFEEMSFSVSDKAIANGTVSEIENGYGVTFEGLENASENSYKAVITIRQKNKTLYTYAIINGGLFMLSPATVNETIKEMTAEEKASLVVGYFGGTPVSGAAGATTEISRLGIPAICLADGPQGVRLAQNAVLYPSGAVTASAWDREAAKTIGSDIGDDCVKTGVDVILGPGMNIQRVAVGGRNFEYFSEDPFLTGKTASSYTEGVESTGTGVSLKHYACNNQESSRGSVSVIATERAIRDIYLRAFGYAVREQNPMTVMSSYNRLSGKYTSVNKPLLNVLRNEFGFTGLVMSDWGSGGSVNEKIEAGNDLTEPGEKAQYDTVLSSFKKGKLEEAALDKAVENILNVVLRSNSYARAYDEASRKKGDILYADHHKDALNTAKSGIVLLKNDNGALPFAKSDGKIALFGDAAVNTVFGGYGSGSVNSSEKVSIESGLAGFGYALETRTERTSEDDIKALSKECTLAVYVISRTSSEGADVDPSEGGFYLTKDEKNDIASLSAAFHAENKHVLVLINTGNPIEVKSWRDSVDAIIWTGFAGETIGEAVASVISGETNPSGKLAITWPESFEDVPYRRTFPGNTSSEYYNDDIYVGYRYYTTFDVPVAYEFGYGLSYTSFAYSDFKVVKEDNGTYTLSVKVKNTGKAAGREVVEFYVSKPSTGDINQPLCELCGYGKTSLLRPGRSQKISVNVTQFELETFVTSEMAFKVLGGSYKFSVGSSCLTRLLDAEAEISENDFEKRTVSEALGTPGYNDVIKPGFKPSDLVKKPSIALGAKAKSGGNESDAYLPANAVDGNLTTRWSAGGLKSKWITVDLGEIKEISEIEVRWESNSAGRYTIAISNDGKNFTDAADVILDESLDMTTDMKGTKTRFIKIYTVEDSPWYSIYEIAVYED